MKIYWNKKLTIVLFLGLSIQATAQFKFEPWDNSKIFEVDKQIHFLGGFILTNQFDKNVGWGKAFIYGQTCSLLWEIKDGFQWGFCWQDHLAFTCGQLVIDHVLYKSNIYDNKELKEILKKRLNNKLYIQF